MTPELQRYYEDILAMFATDAWKAFAEDAERMRKQYSDVRNVTDLSYAKGQLDILDWLANAPQTYETAYKELQQEE